MKTFTTQQIIDNASSISSLEKEIYDLNESIAYDQLDDQDREQREIDLNFADEQLEKEEEIKLQIINQLDRERYDINGKELPPFLKKQNG